MTDQVQVLEAVATLNNDQMGLTPSQDRTGYSIGFRIHQFPLLNDYERKELVAVEEKIADFELVIKGCISNKANMFCNGAIISGPPGTGKTHNIMNWAQDLLDIAVIKQYKKYSGKITPLTLFNVLSENNGPDNVLVLDDIDCWWNIDALNLLKAAHDTKSEHPRNVTYGSRGSMNSFEYTGFTIIITNQKLEEWNNDDVKAVVDRMHMMKLNLTREDIIMKNTSIVEEFLNASVDLSDVIRNDVRAFYVNEVKEFFQYVDKDGKDVFARANVNFSVRWVKKVIDLQMIFGSKWKNFSIEYQRLVAELDRMKAGKF